MNVTTGIELPPGLPLEKLHGHFGPKVTFDVYVLDFHDQKVPATIWFDADDGRVFRLFAPAQDEPALAEVAGCDGDVQAVLTGSEAFEDRNTDPPVRTETLHAVLVSFNPSGGKP